jgi:VIT1/CCC1 family predicted Fe2+/Mn2+ transporter
MIATLRSKQFLTADERVSEVLFGLIMVLTFTGSLSVASAGHAEVREMLIGALGCNFAWGLIDGIMYLMSCLAEKGGKIRIWKAFKSAPDPSSAYHVLESTLPPMMSELLTPRAYEAMRVDLIKLPDPPDHPGLAKEEWLGGLMVFLWVFATTFPVAVPFLVMHNVWLALRVSNTIAIVLLFVTGYAFGRSAEYKPWVTGLAMVGLGCLLVGLTIELGG